MQETLTCSIGSKPERKLHPQPVSHGFWFSLSHVYEGFRMFMSIPETYNIVRRQLFLSVHLKIRFYQSLKQIILKTGAKERVVVNRLQALKRCQIFHT